MFNTHREIRLLYRKLLRSLVVLRHLPLRAFIQGELVRINEVRDRVLRDSFKSVPRHLRRGHVFFDGVKAACVGKHLPPKHWIHVENMRLTLV